jgi:dynein heavy chain
MQQIQTAEDPQAEMTPITLYNKFIDRVRLHLHIILAFSPIGDSFRNNLRMFPALINCCTIDWFKVFTFLFFCYFSQGFNQSN